MLLDTLAQSLGEYLGSIDGGFGEDHHELLAAVARDDVDGAHVAAHLHPHLPQDVVANQVAVLIVDPLEVIDVHHEHRQLLMKPARAIDFVSLRNHSEGAHPMAWARGVLEEHAPCDEPSGTDAS